jgi:3-dehydroquinate synthase
MEINSNQYPHPVFVGSVLNDELETFILKYAKHGGDIAVICDSNTAKHCYPRVKEKLKNKFNLNFLEFPEGEKSKSLNTCEKIWKYFTECGLRKDSLVINLGGGVVSDIGGFCSSLYLRGIPFINIPTSLMAMVDAALGGKTGIDSGELKNNIGIINFPEGVFVDVDFLKTLPKREFFSGYNEMIKHGLIANKEYYLDLTDNKFLNNFEDAIIKSIKIKMDIVVKDPYDKDIRKTLNFGHTIGHAIESTYLKYSNKSVLHGEAVLLGMITESILSEMKGIMASDELKAIMSRLQPRVSKIIIDENTINEVIQLLMYDKKHTSDQLNFTLLEKPGKAIINQNLDVSQIRQSLSLLSEITKQQ